MAKVLNGTSGNDSINNQNDNVKISSGNGNDFILNTGSKVSINSGAGSDNIGVGINASKVTISGGTGDDYITSNTDKGVLFEYKSGDGIDFINGFNSNDTLKINTSSFSTMVSGNDFIVSVGSGYVVLKNSASIPVKVKNSAGKLTTYNTKPSYILFGTDYDDVITNTSKNVSVLGYAGNDTIWNYVDGVVIYGGDGHDDVFSNGNNAYISGGNGADSINSKGDNNLLFGDTGNDTLLVQGALNSVSGGTGNDLIILDANYGNNAINYSLGDGYDTVYGFNSRDVVWAYDTFWNTSTIGNDVVLSFQNGSVTLKDTASIRPRLALNITDKVTDGTILEATEIIDASTRKKAIKITCNELSNEIYGGAGKDSLYGGDGNDTIFGNAGNDKLYGQNGSDMLSGGKGNDTLWGGAGDDLFIYTTGKDVIADYETGDEISFGAAISKASVSGSNVVFTTKNGSLTVKNAKNKTIRLITSTGKSLSTVIGGASTLTLTDSNNSKVTLGSGVTVGDATARTKAIRLTGNELNNSILGGSGKDTLYGADGNDYLSGSAGNDKLYGQNGNDTLWGGAGNDTLNGGTGADTFIYNSGEGKDVISDFDNSDMLQITGTFSASYNSSKKTIAFKVGSTASAITLKNFTATTFNINGDSYQISGTKLVKK